MEIYTCTFTGGKWFCPHDCDDPAHGRQGVNRIYYRGVYYKPGQQIIDNN